MFRSVAYLGRPCPWPPLERPKTFFLTRYTVKNGISNIYFIYYSRCVIAELFSEGSSLFDLSQLLAYRNGDYDPAPVLEKIEDVEIRVSEVNI